MASETSQHDSDGTLGRIDAQVKRFEKAWHGVIPPSIDDFLQGDGQSRLELLIELVHADLEFRFRRGEAVKAEAYWERYPELKSAPQTLVELVWAEFQLNLEREPGLLIEELLRDRPQLREVIDRPLDKDTPVAVPEIPGYKLGELLGRGGMGIVYRATDVRLNRDVAIKFALSGELVSPREQARFLREAKAAAALHHPQVLQIYDFGCHQRQWYLILEYAPGGSLAKKLSGRPLAPLEAARLLVGLARAIEVSHQKQIIHRDLKPANILIGADGQAKIADFGLAKQLSLDSSVTQDEVVLATPSYSAPELVFGKKHFDPRSADIYSLGAVLYETLTGRPPYIGGSALDIVDQLRTSDVIHPRRLNPAVPLDLQNICLKCLEYDPKRRYATARELADDLERFIQDLPVLARPVSRAVGAWRWMRRNQSLTAAIGVSVLFLMLTTAIVTYAAKEVAELNSRASVAYESQRTAWAQAEEAQQETTDWQQAADSVLASLEQSIPVFGRGSSIEPVSLNLESQRKILLSQYELARLRKEADISKRASEMIAISQALLTLGAYPDARKIGEDAVKLFDEAQEEGAQQPELHAAALMVLGRAETENRVLDLATSRFELAHQLLSKSKEDTTVAMAELVLSRARLLMFARRKDDLIQECSAVQHAAEIINQAEEADPVKAIIARAIAINTAWVAGKDSLECAQDLEALYRKIEGKNDLGFMRLCVADDLAVLHQRQFRFEQAERWIDEALQLDEPVFAGQQHPVRSELYSDAAWIKHSRGKQVQALDYYRDAFRIRVNSSGMDFATRELRGEYIKRLLGQNELLELNTELAKLEPEMGSFDWHDVWILRSIFANALLQGDIATAKRATARFGELASTSHAYDQELFDIMQAAIACAQGDFSAAANLANRWLDEICAEPDVAIRAGRLGSWQPIGQQLGWLGRPQLIDQAVALRLDLIPSEFPDFHVDDWGRYCEIIDQLGRDNRMLAKLDIWQRSKPGKVHPQHPCEGMFCCATARQLLAIGKALEAKAEVERGLQILEESLGRHHYRTLDNMILLAELHWELKDKDRAGQLCQEVLNRVEKACGTDHPVLAHWKAVVAARCMAQALPKAARQACLESVDVARRQLGPYHLMTLECIGSAAMVLHAQGDAQRADSMLEEALTTLQARAQPRSPWIFWLKALQMKVSTSRLAQQDSENLNLEVRAIQECHDYIKPFWGESDWRVQLLRR